MTARDQKRLALLLGTVLILTCAAPAVAQPVNTPYDSNANGTLDSVIVDGDYDGDGQREPEDIQAGIHAIDDRLPGEPGLVVVRPHTYRELCRGLNDPPGYCAGDPHIWCYPFYGDLQCLNAGLTGSDAQCVPISCEAWDVRPYAGTGMPRPNKAALIDLDADDANLTIRCDPGTRIEGIWSKRRFDGSSPPLGATGLGTKSARLLSVTGTHAVTVTGCDLDNGMPRGLGAYDPEAGDWPLAADGGTSVALVDAGAGWRDDEWRHWWVMLRPGCEGPLTPFSWCSAPEEFVQITGVEDATNTLTVTGFSTPPLASERYVILYHSGGVCTGDRATPCLIDTHCADVGGSCDLSVQDDPAHSSWQTVYLSAVEDVRFQGVRISGSAHTGFYAKNSRGIELVDSELLENGGYYGHGYQKGWPSIYLFSGVPDPPCFEGGTDCRLIGARIENTEIHHGGTGVNLRWAPTPGQMMYIEELEVRNSHIHDLFAADGSDFPGILCEGKDAICEGNLVERAGLGIAVGGDIVYGWPSETPVLGNRLNSWGVRVRSNAIRDLWRMRGSAPSFGIYALYGNEDLFFETNSIARVGVGPGAPGVGYGMTLNGPNRNATVAGTLVSDVPGTSLHFTNSGGTPPPVGEWREWMDLEVGSRDLGDDPALHVGDPAGFDGPDAVERLELLLGARVALRDATAAGRHVGRRSGRREGRRAEALYVRTLVLADTQSRLNLNGLHLYVENLIGNPAQIIDLPTSCPDGALDPGEACDDANTVWGDGCSPQCRLEQEAALYGLAEGSGFVEIVVEGHVFSVPTAPLQNSIDLLAQLAAAINAEPALELSGVGAAAVGNRLVVAGTIDAYTVADGRLFDALPIVPGLGGRGRLALALALLASGVALVRRSRAGR